MGGLIFLWGGFARVTWTERTEVGGHATMPCLRGLVDEYWQSVLSWAVSRVCGGAMVVGIRAVDRYSAVEVLEEGQGRDADSGRTDR